MLVMYLCVIGIDVGHVFGVIGFDVGHVFVGYRYRCWSCICVLSGHVYMCAKWSCICVLSGHVYVC